MIVVEFFDFNPLDNLIATLTLNPSRIIMLINRSRFSKRRLDEFKFFLHLFRKDIKIDVEFYTEITPTEIEKVCNRIHKRHPGAYYNLTGGGELVASLLSLWSVDKKATLFYISVTEENMTLITNNSLSIHPVNIPDLTIPEVIALSGGLFKRTDHMQVNIDDRHLKTLLKKGFRVFLRNHAKWHALSSYMQQAKRYVVPHSNPIRIECKKNYKALNDKTYTVPIYILEQLSSAGLIKNLVHTKKKTAFTLTRNELLEPLCMHGSFLELFCQIEANESMYFHDVRGSVVIDGDGAINDFAEIQNEIDLICTKGVVPLFISCKSSVPSPLSLSEIKLLAMRFGGENCRAILVTAADVRKENLSLYKRALEMGVYIIDKNDLSSERFQYRLIEITEDKNHSKLFIKDYQNFSQYSYNI